MVRTEAETHNDVASGGSTRPTMLKHGSATDRDLLMWCRSFFYTVTLGALMGKVVLHLYHQSGDLWKGLAARLQGVHSVGYVLIVLGSAILLVGLIVQGIRIQKGR
jgi:hypothetical protein